MVCPLSADGDGALLNVNADVVAAALARQLAAVKLILLTGVEGIRQHPEDPASLVSYTDLRASSTTPRPRPVLGAGFQQRRTLPVRRSWTR